MRRRSVRLRVLSIPSAFAEDPTLREKGGIPLVAVEDVRAR